MPSATVIPRVAISASMVTSTPLVPEEWQQKSEPVLQGVPEGELRWPPKWDDEQATMDVSTKLTRSGGSTLARCIWGQPAGHALGISLS